MKTCKDCKEIDCYRDQYADSGACEDFTSEAIEEEPTEWQPTLEDYREMKGDREAAFERIEAKDTLIAELEKRVEGYENAIAELVRWAQGDEAP